MTCATHNPDLKIAGVLASYDPRTTLSETTVSEIEAQGLRLQHKDSYFR